jgi:hypothetical protein
MNDTITEQDERRVYLEELIYLVSVREGMLQAYVSQLHQQIDEIRYQDGEEARYIDWDEFLENEKAVFDRFWNAVREIY